MSNNLNPQQFTALPSKLPNGDYVSEWGDANRGGQYDHLLAAHHGKTKEYAGHLAVASVGSEHHVQFMETPEGMHGRGTMTGLVQHFRTHIMEPGDTLNWGMQTPDGAKWIAKHGGGK